MLNTLLHEHQNSQRQSKIKRCGQENHNFDDDFTIIELQNSLKHLK